MRLASLVLALGFVAACDHRPEDFARVRDDTAAFQASWQQRIDTLTSRQTQMFQRAQGIPAGTPGLDQVLNGLVAAKASIEAMQSQLTAATTEAEQRITARQRRLAGESLERARTDLDTSLQNISKTLDDLSPQLDATIAAASKAKEPVRTDGLPITDPAFARGRGSTDVAGIVFRKDTAEFDLSSPSTKSALDQIVAFAGSCPELRFALVGHTAKDGDAAVNQRLSEAQAAAVQKYLVDHKVELAQISQVQGVGGTQPLVAEPDPGTDEEKRMDTGALADVRTANRRISVIVLEPCKS